MRRFRRATTSRSAGFTLVEVLITVVIGSLMFTAATQVYLSQVRSDMLLDTTLLLRQQANRAARWIDSEAFRASGFDNVNATNCTAPAGTSLRFSMRVPDPDNPASVVRVSFYSPTGSTFGNVVRCGPPVLCPSGTACALAITGAPVVYLVSGNAQLSVNPAPGATPVRSIRYTLNLRSRDISTELTRSAFAGAPDFTPPPPSP